VRSEIFPSLLQPAFERNDTEKTIDEALRHCATGNIAGLRTLHDVTAPGLLGLLVQMFGEREAAERSLQIGFVEIWQHAAQFNPQRSTAFVWLLAQVRQLALDQLRNQGSQTAAAEVSLALLAAEHLSAVSVTQEPVSPLRNCLASLPTQQQQCLQLAYLYGQSPNQIAAVLEVPLFIARRDIRRALQAVFAHFSAAKREASRNELLAGAYAVGTLSRLTRRRFRTVMSADLAARRACYLWETWLSGFTRDCLPIRPDDGAAEQVLNRVAVEQKGSASKGRWLWMAGIVIAAALALIFQRTIHRP
jgi:RNA polymerase sigma-70 factor, ECF subfamily